MQHIHEYKIKKQFYYPMHTFAFGQYTSCSSELMYKIAGVFDGMFGYIQDAKTVGTIFINGIAYTLVTAANTAMLKVLLNGKEIEPKYKHKKHKGAI